MSTDVNPGSGRVEGEDEEQPTKTGRSAFFAGVHQADSFSGSYRGVKSVPHGGAASVKDEDTIGGADCWCGKTYGHDWPGKSAGRKHPRQTEEESAVAARQVEVERGLNTTDLKSWDRRVAKFICDLVNDFGVKYRIIDGGHLMLYPLDDSRPKKMSASRHPESSLTYLEQWVRDHIAPNMVESKVEALAERFNDPTKKPHKKAQAAPVAPAESPVVAKPAAAVVATPATPSVPDDGAPEGYHQHHQRNGEQTNWWERDDNLHYRCKSCDYEVDGSLQHRAAHQRMHSMTDEERSAVSASAAATQDHEWQAKRTKIRNLIRFLMDEYDITLKQPKAKADTGKVAKLEAQLAKVTAERDECRARLDLIRESMRA